MMKGFPMHYMYRCLSINLGMVIGISLCFCLPMVSIFIHSTAYSDTIIATVNGIPVTESELDHVINEYKKRTGVNKINKEIKKRLVRNLIRRKLILQQDIIQKFRQDEDIQKRVKEYEDSLVVARYLEKKIGAKLKVTDKEIKEYYEKNRYKFATPPKVVARHILLRTRKEAEMVLAKLKKGEDFTRLAKEYSIDLPMALEGGAMGTIEKGKTLPALESVLFTLKPGEISDIVKTRFGYHIITVDKIISAKFKSLKEVKEEIKRTILRQKETKAFDNMVEELEKNAQIAIFEDRFAEKEGH